MSTVTPLDWISFLHIISTISFPLLGNDWAKALGKKMKSDKAPAEHKNLSAKCRWFRSRVMIFMKQGGLSQGGSPLIIIS